MIASSMIGRGAIAYAAHARPKIGDCDGLAGDSRTRELPTPALKALAMTLFFLS